MFNAVKFESFVHIFGRRRRVDHIFDQIFTFPFPYFVGQNNL